MEKEAAVLKRKIGLISGICLNIGTIIGSGIFITSRGVLGNSGSSASAIIVWVVCGLLSAIGGHCFAELGTTFPESGAEYTYIYKAFGPFLAFFRIWCEAVIVRPCSLNVMALTFSTYLLTAINGTCPVPSASLRIVALLVLLLLLFVNSTSVKVTMMIQNVTTFVKVVALVLIIGCGFYQATQSCCDNINFEGKVPTIPDISFAMLSGLHAYVGWHRINIVVEELKNPIKNLPLAIWISMAVVTILYVLTNFSYSTVMSTPEMLATPAIGIAFARRMFGPVWWIMPLFIALSVFGTLNGSLFGAARYVYIAARNGHLPSIFNMVQLTHHTPVCAVIGQVGIAIVFLLLSVDVFFLINSSGVVFWIGMMLSVAALVYMRFKNPDLVRPYKVHMFWPIAFLLFGSILLVFIPVIFRFNEVLFGVGMLLTSIPAYIIGVQWQKKTPYYYRCLEKFTVFVQKLFNCLKEEVHE